MKYKWIVAATSAAVLLVTGTIGYYQSRPQARYHQHLSAEEKTPCAHDSSRFCTHLPLVEIETGGQEIPGKTVYTEDGRSAGYSTTPDGATTIQARLRIIDHETENNHLDDAADLNSDILINVRGHSSRAFDKSGYAIRLITESGENNSQSIMGMAAHHEWVMHGPFLDKTLVRNYMWYNIAGEIMDYAPSVRFCEAFIDGEYVGVYVMTESITGGAKQVRLPLEVNRKQNTYVGYLLRLDRPEPYSIQTADTLTHYAYINRTSALEILYPGKNSLTPEMQRAITQDFSNFEKALYSFDYNNKKYGYADRIDADSFADYFIINELSLNYDAGWYSTYIYKDTNGKFRMCVWDFNNACDNYQESPMAHDSFELQKGTWFDMLTRDEDFNRNIIRRYRRFRESYLSDEYLDRYIDETIAYLGDAVERNFERWGYTFDEDCKLLNPVERNAHSYAEAVQDLKDSIHKRGAFLDKNIDTILQYSAESKVKKYNENTD